jgi:gliding motility-associated-like protein
VEHRRNQRQHRGQPAGNLHANLHHTSANGTSATFTHHVRAFTPPSVTLSGDTLLCRGRTGQVTAAAPGATRYQWSTGATSATASIAQAGTYTVTAYFGSGCARQQLVRVRQAPSPPPLTMGNDTTLCKSQSLVLRAPATPGVAPAYRWSDGSTAPTLRVEQSGTYSLQITAACESRTLTRRVATAPCLTIPNVITPNADHLNDRWVVAGLWGQGWAVEIFDRWGRRVYQNANYANEWGENAGAGIYYYLLRRVSPNAVHKGWVEVIR